MMPTKFGAVSCAWRKVYRRKQVQAQDVAAAGITNQSETTIVWD
jgi:glycerol kinase